MSVISASVNIVLPASNVTNISGSYTLRAYVNGTPIVDGSIGSVSFYYQPWWATEAANETWILIASVQNTSKNQTVFSTIWDTTALNGKNYTINATTYNYTYGTTANETNISGNMTIDNTAPTIAVYGISPTAYANGTSIKTSTSSANNLTLSILITDATIGMANTSTAVCFINVGGGVNHTIPMFNTGLTTGWCNASDTNATTALNISDLSDGNNTINIYVNDTLTNLLNSTLVVQIDTTAPIATATCSPSTVQTGESFPCTCSTSDATSGINSASSGGTSTSPDGTSTPSNTGTFTYTCSATDNGGLTASATTTYSITQIPGGETTGGTATTWVTHSISEEVFEQGHTRELGTMSRLKVQVGAEDHYIGVVSITSDKATIQISSNPTNITLSAGEEAKIDVTDDGFYDIYVLLNGIVNNRANITIQKINEEIPEGEGEVSTTGEIEDGTLAEKKGLGWWWAVIIAGAIVVAYLLSSKAFKKR